MAPFEGFEEKDFLAYQETKWRSRMYNLERLQVKQKLLALSREIESELGSELSSLQAGVTSESPSVWNNQEVKEHWLYFTRTEEEARRLAPLAAKDRSLALDVMNPDRHCQHAALGVVIDAKGLRIGLYLHLNAKVDRRNLHVIVSDTLSLQRLHHLVSSLPQGFTVRVGTDEKPVSEFGVAQELGAFLQRLDEKEWLSFERRHEVREVVSSGPSFTQEVCAALREHILPLFKLISWTPENDLAGLKKSMDTQRKERKRRDVALSSGDSVRVTSGPFAGKVGRLESIDKKGTASVRLGLLSVKVDGKHLVKIK